MKKIYISGKIRGLSQMQALYNFNKAQVYLSDKYGCGVLNPMVEVPWVKGKQWVDYMLEDIKLLFECDAIYMLSNWKDSKGALIEHEIAKGLGLKIIYQ